MMVSILLTCGKLLYDCNISLRGLDPYNWINSATCYWSVWRKPWYWEVMYMCVWGIMYCLWFYDWTVLMVFCFSFYLWRWILY